MIIGTCSICGGTVARPDAWLGLIPPTPTCLLCGATKKKDPHGPVIEMEPVKDRPRSYPMDTDRTDSPIPPRPFTTCEEKGEPR